MSVNDILLAVLLLALTVFIIVLITVLRKVVTTVKEVNTLVKEVTNSLTIITKDVDNLSIEVEGLLNKANVLVDDINSKLEKTDPAFVAIGEIGSSVADVNRSALDLKNRMVLKRKQTSQSIVKLGKSAVSLFKKPKKTTIKKY